MIENIPQLSTIKIDSNGETGTALLFFPGQDVDYVYVFTAKHCLSGKNFDLKYSYKEIELTNIFNSLTGDYHSYKLTETDVISVSPNDEDLALIIIPKQRILDLTGIEFEYQIINTEPAITEYIIRGYANFNNQDADRPFPLKFIEDQKDNKNLFLLKSSQNLDTFYAQALNNVEGLSGSGAFAIVRENLYLTGIVHNYEDGNIFTATKILVYNQLIDSSKFKLLAIVKPETNDAIVRTFKQMDANHEEISRRIKDTVGLVNIPRETSGIHKMLELSGLVVIHGKPGVGKSALAKSIITILKSKSAASVIVFTAEHLYCNTISEALTKAGYAADFTDIIASPLSGRRKIIWIESFEKLIESGFDGAIKELFSLMKTRQNLQMVVTIRDYTLQKFKINYRFELPAGNIYYQLQEFSELEMSLIIKEIPEITPLMGNQKIHHLLRTPYYLDKAVRIIPDLMTVNQLDEVGFKKLMWENIVEAGQSQRGITFTNICLKRANEMSLFTFTEEPTELIAELIRDNILKKATDELSNRYSPSHDILEDWALIRVIKQKLLDAESPNSFISSLINSPAMNRSFRLWLDEYYKNEPQSSAIFVQTVLLDQDVDQNWKDVLLIATLRSDHPEILLDTLAVELLEDQGKLLFHIIKLLQTGCKTIDYKNRDLNHHIPTGVGWDYIIQYIRKNLEVIRSFNSFEYTYLSVIESWSKQLPEFNIHLLPSSASDAAFLLADYIERHQDRISGYQQQRTDNSILKKYITILFKLTAAAQDIIGNLLLASINPNEENRRWTDKNLLQNIRYYLIEGVLSDQICKFFPDEVISIAKKEWTKKEEIKISGSFSSWIKEAPDVNDFGQDDRIQYDYDFPSGYQTFFYWIFLHHPNKAIDFLMPFLNHAFDKNWISRSSNESDSQKISIIFIDGLSKEYLGCSEYWMMYRGVNSRNHIITSLLMALEKGMLDKADEGKQNNEVLIQLSERLIKETNNVSVLAVVSSLIQAYPYLLNEISVSLFGIREFFQWDGFRYNNEFMEMKPYNRSDFLKQERLIENKRPHRRKYYMGQVGFVADYMFFHQTFNEYLFRQVDQMWESCPEGGTIWRKFLFDMDFRKYNLKPFEKPGYDNMLQILPGYDKQVQTMMSTNNNDLGHIPIADFLWIKRVFDNEIVADKSYEVWKNGYEYILNNKAEAWTITSPGALAAIGLRDFASQLTIEEIEWCQQVLHKYGKSLIKSSNHFASGSFALDNKQAMIGLSFIFDANPSETIATETKELIFRLLISNIDEEPKKYLEAGLSNYLARSQPDFVRDCWFGILKYINQKIIEYNSKRQGIHFEDDELIIPNVNTNERKQKKWLDNLIKSVVKGTILVPTEVDLSLQYATESLLIDSLRIIPFDTKFNLHHEFIAKLLTCHVDFLNNKNQRHRNEFFNCRHEFTFFYPRYLLAQPMGDAENYFTNLLNLILPIDGVNPSEELLNFVNGVLKEHIRSVNSGSSVTNFWKLWEVLRIWMLAQNKGFLLPLFLMDIEWTETSKKWWVLEGKNLYYKDFVIKYGWNQINTSIQFLAGIAFNNFMPDSLSWIALMLNSERANQVDSSLANTFIQEAFYNYGAEIKGSKPLLNDFIFILDFLIKRESTQAYMIKEELIQYKL